jgi:hypothetical protein
MMQTEPSRGPVGPDGPGLVNDALASSSSRSYPGEPLTFMLAPHLKAGAGAEADEDACACTLTVAARAGLGAAARTGRVPWRIAGSALDAALTALILAGASLKAILVREASEGIAAVGLMVSEAISIWMQQGGPWLLGATRWEVWL